MSKTYTAVRKFDAETEPKMGPHESAILKVIEDAGADGIERTEIVAALEAQKEAGALTTNQGLSGMFSFHQRSLRIRGLVNVIVTTQAATRKTTLSEKVYSKVRDFDADAEPKLSPSEALIWLLITAEGVSRSHLIASIDNAIESKEITTKQKAGSLVSTSVTSLSKRGLVVTTSVEVERPVVAKEAEPLKAVG